MEFASKSTPNASGFRSTFTTVGGAVAGKFFCPLPPVIYLRRLMLKQVLKLCRSRESHTFGLCLWVSTLVFQVKKSGSGSELRRYPIDGVLVNVELMK